MELFVSKRGGRDPTRTSLPSTPTPPNHLNTPENRPPIVSYLRSFLLEIFLVAPTLSIPTPPSLPTMPGLNSAAGLLGLLQEPDDQLRCFALQKLDQNVDQFWAQIADSVPMM